MSETPNPSQASENTSDPINDINKQEPEQAQTPEKIAVDEGKKQGDETASDDNTAQAEEEMDQSTHEATASSSEEKKASIEPEMLSTESEPQDDSPQQDQIREMYPKKISIAEPDS